MRRGSLLPACLVWAVACAGDVSEGNTPVGGAPGTAERPAPVLESTTDTSGHVVVGDTRVYYTAFGAGSPVVAIHGGPGLDQEYMRPWLDDVADFARIIYVDQRGTGGSTGPLTAGEINLDALVDDVDHVRSTMGYEAVTVLGHSWGGLLALAYAMRYPDRTEGLVLMSTAEPGLRFAAEAQRNQAGRRSEDDQARIREIMAMDAFTAGESEAVSEVFKIVFRSTLADPAHLERLNLDLTPRTAENRGRVGELLQQTMEQPDWWGDFSSLSVPTLILHGRHDPQPVEMAREMGDSIPGADVVILRNSGHFPFAEEPEAVVDALRSFLGG